MNGPELTKLAASVAFGLVIHFFCIGRGAPQGDDVEEVAARVGQGEDERLVVRGRDAELLEGGVDVGVASAGLVPFSLRMASAPLTVAQELLVVRSRGADR